MCDPRRGLCIPATIMLTPGHVQALRRANLPPEPPLDVVALIDTGASACALDRRVIGRLGLRQVNVVEVHSPTTEGAAERRRTYDGCLVLDPRGPEPLHLGLEFIEASFQPQGFDLLLGRDALCECRLSYIGRSGKFRLSWR